MSDDAPTPPSDPSQSPGAPATGPSTDDRRKRKKAEKARGAWISFAGRIVAQIVGAVASVVLGLYVIQRSQQPAATPAAAPAASLSAPRASGPRRPGPATIAVLPLANLSGRADQEYFVDGMAEALTASLARIEGLRVISRTSTMRYRVDPPALPEIAQALGADLLIEGSVLQADGSVRITAQLIDGASDEHLWAESYTRPLKDVIALQDAVATAIATEIKGTVSRRPATGAAAGHVVDAATYDLYLRGRHAWYVRTPEAMQTALAFFEKAAAADPQFALAHAGIADTYVLQQTPRMPLDAGRDRLEKARAAAMRALDLDGGLAEAHTALGGVIFFGDRDLADAQQKFRRAIELNPNYPVAHEWLGLLLGELGRTDEALQHADIAVSLDPFEATMYQARGFVLYNGRRFDDAAESLRRARVLAPQLPLVRVLLARTQVLQGTPADALGECADLADVPADIDRRIVCVVAAVRAGRTDVAARFRAPLEARRPQPGAALAQIDAALERFPEAFGRLDVLARRGAVPPIFAIDPLFEGLRRQPRWAAIATAAPAHAPVRPAR